MKQKYGPKWSRLPSDMTNVENKLQLKGNFHLKQTDLI